MPSDADNARAVLAQVEASMANIPRPVADLRDILNQHAHEAFNRRLDEWRQANPEAESRWQALRAQAAESERRLAQAEATAAEETRALARLEALDIGARTLEGLRLNGATPAMDAVRRWLSAQPRPWALVMLGGVGCGKTVAAAFAARRALASGKSVAWVHATQTSRESAFGPEAEARERRWRSVGLLVLDDLGAEFASELWTATVAAVLDARWRNAAPTVLTSNLDLEALRLRLGARTMDRLAQEGRVEACGDVSLRRRSA